MLLRREAKVQATQEAFRVRSCPSVKLTLKSTFSGGTSTLRLVHHFAPTAMWPAATPAAAVYTPSGGNPSSTGGLTTDEVRAATMAAVRAAAAGVVAAAMGAGWQGRKELWKKAGWQGCLRVRRGIGHVPHHPRLTIGTFDGNGTATRCLNQCEGGFPERSGDVTTRWHTRFASLGLGRTAAHLSVRSPYPWFLHVFTMVECGLEATMQEWVVPARGG